MYVLSGLLPTKSPKLVARKPARFKTAVVLSLPVPYGSSTVHDRPEELIFCLRLDTPRPSRTPQAETTGSQIGRTEWSSMWTSTTNPTISIALIQVLFSKYFKMAVGGTR
jgi:hypothetical protein